MADTPKPLRPKLRVVPTDPSAEPGDTQPFERVTLPDGPITERVDVPVTVRNNLELNLRVESFSPDDVLATACEPVDEAYLIIDGRVAIYAIDGRGELMTSAIRELAGGDVVNPELFTRKGGYGTDSAFTVKAKTQVRAYALTLEDLFDPAVSDIERRKRMCVIANALAGYAIDAANQRVRNHEDTTLFEEALDAERERIRAGEVRIRELSQSLEVLDSRTRQITREFVNATLLSRLQDLERENTTLRRQVLERTAEAMSAKSIVEMLYGELDKIERSQHVDEMSKMRAAEIISLLTRIYVAMMQSGDQQLGTIALHGMNEIHRRIKADSVL